MQNTTTGPIAGAIAALAKLNAAIEEYDGTVDSLSMGASETRRVGAQQQRVEAALSDVSVQIVHLRDSVESAVNTAVDETIEQLDERLLGEDGQNVGSMIANQVISRLDGVAQGADFCAIAASCFDDPSEYGDLFPALATS